MSKINPSLLHKLEQDKSEYIQCVVTTIVSEPLSIEIICKLFNAYGFKVDSSKIYPMPKFSSDKREETKVYFYGKGKSYTIKANVFRAMDQMYPRRYWICSYYGLDTY